MMKKHPEHGFTLLEMVIVIAVLAILAAAISPALLQQVIENRVEATRQEELTLYQAMLGHPDDQGTYGFVGDIGRLPQTVAELLQPGGLPPYNTSTTRQVGMGWNGPYANFGNTANQMLKDPWGRAYTLVNGQVRSAGPDGTPGNADDIVYPVAPPNISGRVQITVKTMVDQKVVVDPPGCRVTLFYAVNGAEASLVDDTAPFIFENVPMGLHAVVVTGPTQVSTSSVVTVGNNGNGVGGGNDDNQGGGGGGGNNTVTAQQTIATYGSGKTKLIEIWY